MNIIKLDNPTEKVVVSPPQLEVPEIKAAGKQIQISLVDSLKPNTTYTIDFSDAISDNNEGNPMGNYTYSFSTGEVIDTMEVSGYVLESENLEPIKGILVGLYCRPCRFCLPYQAYASCKPYRQPWPLRHQGCGTGLLPHLCPAGYGWQLYVQSEEARRLLSLTTSSCHPASRMYRQDTTWIDSLHIKSIDQVNYTHFLPDDIVLRAFTECAYRPLLPQGRAQGGQLFLALLQLWRFHHAYGQRIKLDAENAFL